MVWSVGQVVPSGAVWSSTVMVWLHEAELPQASVAVQVRRMLVAAEDEAATFWSTKVTVRLASQPSVKLGSPKAGWAGHWMVWSVGQVVTTGAAWSSTVMVWLQVAELPRAAVGGQGRLSLAAAGPLACRFWSANVTVGLGSEVAAN